MDASLIVAIAAALIAGLSLVISWVYARRAHHANTQMISLTERAERRAEEAAAREIQNFVESREALPSATYVEGPTPITGGYTYRFEVKNRGAVFADNPIAWLADPEGNPVGDRATMEDAQRSGLDPGETGIFRPLARTLDHPLTLHLTWYDNWPGEHHRISRVSVPLKEGHSTSTDTQG